MMMLLLLLLTVRALEMGCWWLISAVREGCMHTIVQSTYHEGEVIVQSTTTFSQAPRCEIQSPRRPFGYLIAISMSVLFNQCETAPED
jgi:hypothetical protein